MVRNRVGPTFDCLLSHELDSLLDLLDVTGSVLKGCFDLPQHILTGSLPVANLAQLQLSANAYQPVHLFDEAGRSVLDLSLFALFQCQQLIANVARDTQKLSF